MLVVSLLTYTFFNHGTHNLWLKCFIWTFFFSLWVDLLYSICSVAFCICVLWVFTIKVTHLFQVERLHKLFPFPLLPLSLQRSLSRRWECLLSEESIPRQPHYCFSFSDLFSPFLPFFSICLITLLLSAVGYQHMCSCDLIPQETLWLSDSGILLVLIETFYC